MSDNFTGSYMDMVYITKVSNCGGYREEGGLIPPLFLPSAVLDDCKDDNDKDGRYIYENDGVTIHNFHVKDGILVGTGAGEV